jgi:hypothetical protein
MGKWERARELHKSELTIARTVGDPRIEGYALFNLSDALYHLGRRAEAIETVQLAVTILERYGSPLAGPARTRLAVWST